MTEIHLDSTSGLKELGLNKTHELQDGMYTDVFAQKALDEVFCKTPAAKCQSDDDITSKANRVVFGLAKGIYDGAAEEIASIVQHPMNILPGIAIGAIGTASLFLPPIVHELIPVVATGAAALELLPNARRISSAISGAWDGSKSLDQTSADLRPLGHMLVTYGIAKSTDGLLRRAVDPAVNWYVNRSFSETGISRLNGLPGGSSSAPSSDLIKSLNEVSRAERLR